MNPYSKINLAGVFLIPAVAAMCYLIQPAEFLNPGLAQAKSNEWVDPDPRPDPAKGKLALGKWVYRRNCSLCHGAEGVGGIKNPNAVVETFPVLKNLARKMTLSNDEEVRTVVSMLEQGTDPGKVKEPPFARWPLFIGQYASIRDLIHKGNKPKKKDEKGIDPQAMPNWGALFSEEDIQATIAYLLSLQTWEEAEPRPDPAKGKVALGKWVFTRNCASCHGENGVGGIANPNYIKDTAPELKTLAERMKLSDGEDTKTIVELLEKGTDLDKLEKPPIAKFNVFLAQYKAIRDVVRGGSSGSKLGRRDANGPAPQPMPEWGKVLSDDEIISVIAYLLTLQPWESDEEESKETPTNPPPQLKHGEPLPDARLVNQDGKAFKLSELKGSVLVLSFIYTNCDIAAMCPMAASKLAEIQKLLAARGVAGVRFLLVSFDPERDTPAKLKEFAARYKVDESTFWFATGKAEEVGPLAKALNNYYKPTSTGTFDHQIVVAIVDPDGIFRDDFFGTGWKEEEFAEAVRKWGKK